MYITALESVACIEFVMTFPDKIFVCINHFIYIYIFIYLLLLLMIFGLLLPFFGSFNLDQLTLSCPCIRLSPLNMIFLIFSSIGATLSLSKFPHFESYLSMLKELHLGMFYKFTRLTCTIVSYTDYVQLVIKNYVNFYRLNFET